MLGSKGLQMEGHDLCRDICLANGSKIKECPNHFHETHIMIIRNSCKINHSTHPCGHSNIRLCGHATLRLRVCFPIQITPVFQRLLFLSSHTNIRVHFGIRENLLLCSPSRCTFLFFKNLSCFDL